MDTGRQALRTETMMQNGGVMVAYGTRMHYGAS